MLQLVLFGVAKVMNSYNSCYTGVYGVGHSPSLSFINSWLYYFSFIPAFSTM